MIWRGPILSGVIRQFYEQRAVERSRRLLIDLPPGTSDAPLTVLQSLSSTASCSSRCRKPSRR
jgi:ATP-binding protein involved in chromosome partitioning